MMVVGSLVVSLIILALINDRANFAAAESFKRVQILNGSPYVQLQHGLYFGKTLDSNGKDAYHAFLGIRYASTPKRYEVGWVKSTGAWELHTFTFFSFSL